MWVSRQESKFAHTCLRKKSQLPLDQHIASRAQTSTRSLIIEEAHPPTVDLHCHLRGAIAPAHAEELAWKHSIALPKAAANGRYCFSTFEEFLTLYDQVGHVIRSAHDLCDVATRYLETVSNQGTCYVEFMISPGHSIANGIDFDSQLAALVDAFDLAQAEFDVFGSIIATCVRHRGPEEATDIAEMCAKRTHPRLRGFGLTGNEHKFHIEEFEGPFMVAQDAGLSLTAHVGEWGNAQEVLRAVDVLNLQRVGHGISVSDEPNIMDELSERKVGFEVCLSSNVQLGASASFKEHQALKMLEAGCLVALSTDDPAYFDTTPNKELFLASKHLELPQARLDQIFSDSIEIAFCDDATKSMLYQRASR